jgi:hypothetical protein
MISDARWRRHAVRAGLLAHAAVHPFVAAAAIRIAMAVHVATTIRHPIARHRLRLHRSIVAAEHRLFARVYEHRLAAEIGSHFNGPLENIERRATRLVDFDVVLRPAHGQ